MPPSITRRALLGALPGLALGCTGSNKPRFGEERGREASFGLETPAFDVCIVGSGFAGMSLGLRLVERGLRTLILEAGPEEGDPRAAAAAGVASSFPIYMGGELDYPVDDARALVVGGTSRRWTGVLNRLRPEDLLTGSSHGLDSDWPIGYEDLEPYYCQAEAALEARGWPEQEGAEPPRSCEYPRQGRQYRPPQLPDGAPSLDFFPLAYSRRWSNGAPVRLAEREVPAFRGSALGTLLSEHGAQRLSFADRRRGADREAVVHDVVTETPAGPRRFRARCYVVAAGVFESSRLLLGSSCEACPTGPGNQSGWLGRGFNAHPAFDLQFPGPAPQGATLYRGIHRTHSIADQLRAQGLNACHLQLHAGPEELRFSAQLELQPRWENRLYLDHDTAGPTGQPLAVLDFGYGERDQRTVAASLALRDELVRATGLALEQGEATRRFRAHPAGTCRMAATPQNGVVDADLKVHGTDNLYVAGASVFPNSGTANPTLTVVALSLRLADHLATRLSED